MIKLTKLFEQKTTTSLEDIPTMIAERKANKKDEDTDEEMNIPNMSKDDPGYDELCDELSITKKIFPDLYKKIMNWD